MTNSFVSLQLQSNLAISNPVNSKSPLFRRKIECPWIYPSPLCFPGYFKAPLFRTFFHFPWDFEIVGFDCSCIEVALYFFVSISLFYLSDTFALFKLAYQCSHKRNLRFLSCYCTVFDNFWFSAFFIWDFYSKTCVAVTAKRVSNCCHDFLTGTQLGFQELNP